MNNKEIDSIVNIGKKIMGEPPNRGREYIEWLDTKPKVFYSFNEWMFHYHYDEVEQ